MDRQHWMKAIHLLGLYLAMVGSFGRVDAQVLIYTIEFETSPKTPDFEFYDGGWIVIDLELEKASFVFTAATTADRGSFIESRGTGDFFFSSVGEFMAGNVRATSNTESVQASYLLTGNIDSSAPVIDPNSKAEVLISVPRTLNGFLLASEAGSYEPGTVGSGEKINLVGISEITATLDTKSSQYYNQHQGTAQEVTDDIIADLLKAGYQKET